MTEFKNILSLHMRDLASQTAKDNLFGTNGPLNTFNSRILIAYHLGWLSIEQKERLDAFRKIRNEFAHRTFQMDFTNPRIASWVARLNYQSSGVFDRINKAVPRLTVQATTLANMIILALYTFQELLIFPIANAHHVHPADVLRREPALLKKVKHALTKSLLMTGIERIK
jgi:DNA-binding MltR family transcriptional regulator